MASSQKRISKELAEVTTNPPDGIHVSLVDESNVHNWNIVMDGPEGSPYAGGKFKLLLVLPTDYPFKPPKISFKTRIWHPNVTFDEHGSMCIGILKPEAWKPSSKILSVLTATQQLLVEPVPDDAVETSAAEKFKNHRAEFNKEAKEYTKKYANPILISAIVRAQLVLCIYIGILRSSRLGYATLAVEGLEGSKRRLFAAKEPGAGRMMSVPQGQNGGAEYGLPDMDSQHLRKQRSHQTMKSSLYPSRARSRPRTASTTSGHVSPASPISPATPVFLPQHPAPRIDPLRSNGYTSNPQSLSTTQQTSSNDSSRSLTSSPQPPQPLHEKPSEASRLRALNSGYRSHSTEGHRTPEIGTAHFDNWSRPRELNAKHKKESGKASIQGSSSLLTQANGEAQTHPDPPGRDRGVSVSSPQSLANNVPPFPLRPSMSIPDYHAPDSIYSRQRNLNNSSYRPGKVMSRPDSNYSSHWREPVMWSAKGDGEEVRASFRSALTTNSSFLGTSGTERSSIMTKSSSATSIFGRDEGMSVDDAIGMYESGFHDSGTEDLPEPRHQSVDSGRGKTLEAEEIVDKPSSPSVGTLPDNPHLASQTSVDNIPSFEEEPDLKSPLDAPPPLPQDLPPSRPATRATRPQPDGTRDRYGFRKNTQYVPLAQYEAWNGPYTEHLARRRKKWVALLKDSGLSTDNPQQFPPKTAKVKRFIRKGVPPDWRGAAWFYYAGGPAMIAKHQGMYEDLNKQAAAGGVNETDSEIIERDLNRTFPDNIKFKPDPPSEGELQQNPEVETPILQSLRRVLQAFAIFNPKIGYCQSLNFLAGLLLLFMDEEKSFWMLNIITRVYLPATHELNLEGANVDLGVLMTSIKDMMPSIWAKIGGELDGSAGDGRVSMRLPPITLCTTAWFMSCFIGTLPIETTLRVWDSFFYEGSKTLFRIALTIFKVGEQEIKAVSDPMEIFQVVQGIPRKLVDANALLEACFRRRNGFGHLSQETIEKGRAERRKGYAEERARAAGQVPTTPKASGMGRRGTIFGRRKQRATEGANA